MEAVRAVQTVQDGQVCLRLPEQFWGQQVEIIVLAVPTEPYRPQEKKSLRGCLRHYADPALAAPEQEVWHKAVEEKHGAR